MPPAGGVVEKVMKIDFIFCICYILKRDNKKMVVMVTWVFVCWHGY